ncbi:A24 family peptidase [Intrasporangium sp.]|uniref:A24 family peptidase n=1 Tax=Intrasporangium sp. TaxID=1925024 RepID=UPI0032218CF3
MPEMSVLLGTAFAGLVAGAVLQSQLVHLRHRLEDERRLPKPSAGWVIPATVVLTVLLWVVLAPGRPPLVPATYVVAGWVMVALAFIDLDVHRLPDRIQLPSYPILAVLLALCSYVTGDWGALLRAGVCGAGLWLFYFLLIFVLPPGSIGFGDVKLAGLLGMLLGWLTWAHPVIATLATFLVGGLVAVVLLVTRRKGRKDEFAYGPSMLLGAVVAIAAPIFVRVLQ